MSPQSGGDRALRCRKSTGREEKVPTQALRTQEKSMPLFWPINLKTDEQIPRKMFATKTAPRRKGNLDIRQPQKALSLSPKPLKAGVRHGSTASEL